MPGFCWMDQNGNALQQQVHQIVAQSAAMLEILAGIKAMDWAYAEGALEIFLQTDYLDKDFVRSVHGIQSLAILCSNLYY